MSNNLVSVAGSIALGLAVMGASPASASGATGVCEPARSSVQLRDTRATIETFLAEWAQANQIPSAHIVVAVDGELVLQFSVGHEEVASSRAFHTASVSKPFVAMAILALVEEGHFELDARVQDLLREPSWAGAGWRDITVRQLLAHRAGIPDAGDYQWGRGDLGDGALAAYVQGLPGSNLDFEPGSGTRYSNPGYSVLARIIEVVSSTSFENHMRDEILRPLGMNQAGFELPPERARYQPHVGMIVPVGTDAYPYNRIHAASSSLHVTRHDAAAWVQALSCSQWSLPVSSAGGLTMWTSHSEVTEGVEYGLGWFVGRSDGQAWVGHPGGDPGFSADMVLWQDLNAASFVLTNTSTVSVQHLRSDIRNWLDGASLRSIPPSALSRWEGFRSAAGDRAAARMILDEVGASDELPGELLPYIFDSLSAGRTDLVLALTSGLTDRFEPTTHALIYQLRIMALRESGDLRGALAVADQVLGVRDHSGIEQERGRILEILGDGD